MSQLLTIGCQNCGGESYDRPGYGLWLICCSHVLSLSYGLIDCTSHLLAVCKLSVTAWIFIKVKVMVKLKVKVKVSLTIYEGPDRGWDVWHLPLLLHSAQM